MNGPQQYTEAMNLLLCADALAAEDPVLPLLHAEALVRATLAATAFQVETLRVAGAQQLPWQDIEQFTANMHEWAEAVRPKTKEDTK